MKVAINVYGLDTWFGGDTRSVIDLVRLAEAKGVDQVNMGEHVAIGEVQDEYPFGKFAAPLDFPWNEPIALLSAIAAATSRIRLSTGVLITPLRPAVLLAKQLATLDVLSRGRVDIGFGVGWHKAEYDAAGVDFADRAAHMEEQARVCKLLWSTAPASFEGRYVRFQRLYSLPFPVQPGGIPIWFGVSPGRRNLERIAELGDGWMPLGLDQTQTAEGVRRIKALMTARGRDPDRLTVRHLLMPVQHSDALFRSEGLADQEAALAAAPGWIAAGATMIEMFPSMFCRGPEQFEGFIDRLVGLKG
jgi:probable F420-dependent oxidoreductase